MKITRVKKNWHEIAQDRTVIEAWSLGGPFPVEINPVHGYTMPTDVVANGYGVSPELILGKKRVLHEGIHFLTQPIGEMDRYSTQWTRLGVVTLGFHLRSLEFALAASDEVSYVEDKETSVEFIVPDDFQCLDRLATLLNEQKLFRDILYEEKAVTPKSRDALREAENSLEGLIQPLKRKAEFFHELLEENGSYSLDTVRCVLRLGLGPVSIFREFRKRDYFINGGRLHNRPHPYWIDQGYFTEDPYEFVTFKGMKWIWENFQNNPMKCKRNRVRCEAEG